MVEKDRIKVFYRKMYQNGEFQGKYFEVFYPEKGFRATETIQALGEEIKEHPGYTNFQIRNLEAPILCTSKHKAAFLDMPLSSNELEELAIELSK